MKKYLFFVLFVFLSTPAWPEEITGKVANLTACAQGFKAKGVQCIRKYGYCPICGEKGTEVKVFFSEEETIGGYTSSTFSTSNTINLMLCPNHHVFWDK